MHENDNVPPACEPTSSGILLCLRMLSEEALSLRLRRSVLALRAAALVIEAETNDMRAAPPAARRFSGIADISTG